MYNMYDLSMILSYFSEELSVILSAQCHTQQKSRCQNYPDFLSVWLEEALASRKNLMTVREMC